MHAAESRMEFDFKMRSYYEEASIPESDRLYLNVGGTLFITSRLALKRYPSTRLGRLALTKIKEFQFDRNPKLVGYILDLYRTGELHMPRNCCSMAMKSEMVFWDIPYDLVSECCFAAFDEGNMNKEVIDDIDQTLKDPYETIVGRPPWSDHIWNTMSNPNYSKTAEIWNIIYNLFVGLAGLCFILESEPSLRSIPDDVKETLKGRLPKPGQFRFLMYSVEIPLLYHIDVVSWIFFTIEFFVRLVVCPSRAIFLKSKLNALDILLIVTVWTSVILKEFEVIMVKFSSYGRIFFVTRVVMNSCKAMRVLRMFVVLYRNEYTKVVLLSLHHSLHPLSLLLLAALMAALIFGALAYMVELIMGSYVFRNMALAMWWGFETMTAIGYGKIVPMTIPGYVIATLCSMFGIILFSMPIAIMSESFKHYMISLRVHKHRIRRRNYLRNQGKQNAYRAMTMFMYTKPYNQVLFQTQMDPSGAAVRFADSQDMI